MPLPLILGIGAAIAAAAGVGSGISGGKKIKEASNTVKEAQERHQANKERLDRQSASTESTMDKLGKSELETMEKFQTFSDMFEKIQNKPEFAEIQSNGVELPHADLEELRKVSVGAITVLGSAKGLAGGALGGIAASGAAYAAVSALGVASTGTAISTLSGVAATNATLAALGGGSLAAGGLGMAGGAMVLGGATLGIGMMVGGLAVNATGNKLMQKADESWEQMKEAEALINRICNYLSRLRSSARKYLDTLTKVNRLYDTHLKDMDRIVNTEQRLDWLTYSEEEQLGIKNTVTLTQLLFSMCKVQLVLKTDDPNGINKINSNAIAKVLDDSDRVMKQIGVAAAVPQQRETGTQAVAFRPYTGSNAEYLKYLINYQTGMDLRQAAELIRTGGTVSVRDAGSFTKDLERLGVEVTSGS